MITLVVSRGHHSLISTDFKPSTLSNMRKGSKVVVQRGKGGGGERMRDKGEREEMGGWEMRKKFRRGEAEEEFIG